jgi:eukaryotic-like serine/threonine-protein kinase
VTREHWRQIEDLYHAARQRNSADRVALLECTDPEIRSRVERMLALDSGGQILDRPAAGILDLSTRTVVLPGEQLGPYQIETLIGVGGMGQVYRAVDTRLDRKVALKVCAEHFNARFDQEARALAALNHLHICTLFDVGPDYLVMELLEGRTLAERIRDGPLGPADVLRFGTQIADALADAHAAGIVHLDLKPGNIMLTLGLVLYEMASGKLPFPGASLGSMLDTGGAVTIPPLSRVHPGLPARLDTLIARLLEQDPAKRLQSAAEVRDQLQKLARTPRANTKVLAGATALSLILAGGLWMFHRASAELGRPGQVTQITPVTSYVGDEREPSLSPDGNQVAFSWNGEKGDNRDIYVMQIGGQAPLRLTHDPAEDDYPAWSPDGKRIAFLRRRTARRWDIDVVSALGGEERKLHETRFDTDHLGDSHPLLAWSPDGNQIVFTVTVRRTPCC